MSRDTDSIRLMAGALLFATTGIMSAHILRNLDREARRLLAVRRKWGPLRRSEGDELTLIRRRALIGYSGFLAISTLMLVTILIKWLR